MTRQARLLWLVRIAIALETFLYAGLIPLLPQLGAEGGLSDSTLGLLLGVYPLAGVFACIPFGFLSDRWRPKPLLAAGTAALALGAVAIGVWPTPLVIGLGRFAQGIAGSAVWTAGFALMNQHAAPDRRGREIGLLYSASSMGELSGPLLSGFLAERASTSLFFWIAAAACSVVGLGLAATRAQQPEQRPAATAVTGGRRAYYAALAGGAALAMLYNVVYGSLMILAPLLLAREGRLTPFAIGQVFLGWQLVLILSQVGGGHWGDRSARFGPILSGTLALSAGLLIMGTWSSLPGVFAGMVLAGIGLGVAATVATPVFSEAWAEARPAGMGMGVAFGVMNTIWAVGFMAGNTGGGLVLTVIPLRAILVGAAGLALAGGLLTGLFGRRLMASPASIAGD